MSQHHNAVDSLLMRLKMGDLIGKMREMKIDRLIVLRKLSEEQLTEIIPDSRKRQQLLEAISSRGNFQSRRSDAAEQAQPPQNIDDDMARNKQHYNNNNNSRFGEGGAITGDGRHDWREGGRGGGFGRGGRGRGMGRGYNNNYNNDNYDNSNMHTGDAPGGVAQVGQRSMNNNNSSTNNISNPRWQQNETPKGCRHFFSEKGCTYGDKCRYSHDEALRNQMTERPEHHRVTHTKAQNNQEIPDNNASENNKDDENHPSPFDSVCIDDYPFNATCEVPSDHMKFLLGSKNNKLGKIHEICNTTNVAIHKPENNLPMVSVTVVGNTKESVERARQMILYAVGAKSEKVKRNRFEYAVNEYTANVQAIKYMAACNTKNKGTNRYLSESIMRNLISTFRFAQPQEIRHFCILSSTNEKEKLDRISKVTTQLDGIQAVIFGSQKHVLEMSKVATRISRFFNNVTPCFVHRSQSKEARMNVLEQFKAGVPNEKGVRQRLLVTSDDYAKLARKTVIPYVNLIVHLTVPNTQEMYVLQSHVAGRQGTIGASLLCVSNLSEMPIFKYLQEGFSFVQLNDGEGFRDTALQLTYDTVDKPLTLPEAEPRPDWRDHINDAKPKDAIVRTKKNATDSSNNHHHQQQQQ